MRFSGSFKDVLRISLPLILSMSSSSLMSLIDRILLSRYDIDHYNAVFVINLMYAAILFFGTGVSSIAEVFCGQYNGLRQYKKIPSPVWQMLYFSLTSAPLLIIAGQYGANLFLPSEAMIAKQYYTIMISFTFISFMITALQSFFISIGHTRVVFYTVLLANTLNVILACLLIYGSDNLLAVYNVNNYFITYIVALCNVAEFGSAGAAMAILISQIVSFVFLLFIFLSKQYRVRYKTSNFYFNYKLFKQCLSVGVPQSIGHFAEMGAWSFIGVLMIKKSFEHITIANIATSIIPLFGFIYEGIVKSCSTIAANLIGQKNIKDISRLINSCMKLHGMFISIACMVLYFFSYNVVSIFIDINQINTHLISICITSLFGVLFYLLIDGTAWILSSVLAAGGDTKFTMVVNTFTAWAFLVFPIYMCVNFFDVSPLIIWVVILPINPLSNSIIYYIRYKQQKWLRLNLEQ